MQIETLTFLVDPLGVGMIIELLFLTILHCLVTLIGASSTLSVHRCFI